MVERDPSTDVVRLRIEAESAHATLLAKWVAPVARYEQNRLTRRYLAALVEHPGAPSPGSDHRPA
ncbi:MULTISPECIES: DUF1990 family protein [unclassified Dietzia]|uniref:DUF1990 family protein n=1 Tax=unclassified Dietzia TaxID=2617939 RepID=UPI001E568A5F|nr:MULTISPECIES: DUF1990 family protein [unclassified Dietzia]